MQPPVTFPLYTSNNSKNHQKMKNRILLAATLFVAAYSLPQPASAQSEKTKTFSGIKSIRLNSASGDCKIQRSKDASVIVFVRTTDSFDKSATTNIDQEGDQLILKEDHFERSGHGSAHWTLTVPDGIKIKMVSGSGNITASDVKVDLKATTGSGDLEFSKLSGTIDATSGSGDLTLDNSDGQIEVTVGSGSGSIQNSKGEIKMTTGSGNIRGSRQPGGFHHDHRKRNGDQQKYYTERLQQIYNRLRKYECIISCFSQT
jgi:hypothetical protein